MNLEEMKTKYKSGKYIAITNNRGFWEKAPTQEALIMWECNHKLIHKKHEDILNAYLKDNNILIEQLDSLNKWVIKPHFLSEYNELWEYRLKLIDNEFYYADEEKKLKSVLFVESLKIFVLLRKLVHIELNTKILKGKN